MQLRKFFASKSEAHRCVKSSTATRQSLGGTHSFSVVTGRPLVPHGSVRWSLQRGHVLLTDFKMVRRTVVSFPDGFAYEQPHGFGVVLQKTPLVTLRPLDHLVRWEMFTSKQTRGHGERTYGLIHCEAVVDAGWQCDHIALVHGDAYPTVFLVPDIEVGRPVKDVADLIVQMQMLVKEHLQLVSTSQEEVFSSQ